MGKLIQHEQLTPTLGLSECTDGFWLWDETRSMNLAMKAKTPQAAFLEALSYYQRRLTQVESEYKALHTKVEAFVDLIRPPEDDEKDW